MSERITRANLEERERDVVLHAAIEVSLANALASHQGVPTPREWEDDDAEAWHSGYEAARLDIGRTVAAILRLDNPHFDAASFFDIAKIA